MKRKTFVKNLSNGNGQWWTDIALKFMIKLWKMWLSLITRNKSIKVTILLRKNSFNIRYLLINFLNVEFFMVIIDLFMWFSSSGYEFFLDANTNQS